MTSLSNMEDEIAQTRARLADTIGRIQDKLTVSGMVDEVLGSAGNVVPFESAYGRSLDVVRRNPVPVLIVAAAVGWALNRLAKRDKRARLLDAETVDVKVVNDGRARRYDPDGPTRHPDAGHPDTGRGASVQA